MECRDGHGYDLPMSEPRCETGGPRLEFIGHIETPYARPEDCPYTVNPGGPVCSIVLHSRFAPGLKGLAAGDRILVLYWLDRAERGKSLVGVRRSGNVAGAFAARTPHRPNPIGAAVVTIEAIDGAALRVRGLDCLSGTPLLDLKPAMRAEAPANAPGV